MQIKHSFIITTDEIVISRQLLERKLAEFNVECHDAWCIAEALESSRTSEIAEAWQDKDIAAGKIAVIEWLLGQRSEL